MSVSCRVLPSLQPVSATMFFLHQLFYYRSLHIVHHYTHLELGWMTTKEDHPHLRIAFTSYIWRVIKFFLLTYSLTPHRYILAFTLSGCFYCLYFFISRFHWALNVGLYKMATKDYSSKVVSLLMGLLSLAWSKYIVNVSCIHIMFVYVFALKLCFQ